MFKVRDLLIVAALVVGGVTVAKWQAIKAYCNPVVKPVQYYVDAPAREAQIREEHANEVAKLREEIAGLHSEVDSALVVAGSLRQQLSHERDVSEAKDVAIADQRSELARLKSRYAALCQRLLELGNDVPSVLAAE